MKLRVCTPVPCRHVRVDQRKLYGRDIDPAECVNVVMEQYYKAQAIVPEPEWPAFLASLRRSLPMTVRVSQFRDGHAEVAAKLAAQPGCGAVEWFPGSVAWRCPSDVFHGDEAQGFRDWVKDQNGVGALTFQEEVSLLPPLLLDLSSDHRVLDMCAAPGSKTHEILEIMHKQHSNQHSAVAGASVAGGSNAGLGCGDGEQQRGPSGVVVANDLDAKRMNNILVPRLRKLHTPCAVMTIGAGAKFPLMHHPDGSPMLFDRVLLDAPCAGDGTIRKEPSIWRSWSVLNGLQLFATQLKLLMRGLTLLRPGGKLVYSTCSLNPVEDEAVVRAALERFKGQVALCDTPAGLAASGLRTCPGLSSWKVPAPSGEHLTLFDRFDQVPEELRTARGRQPAIVRHMFPAGSGEPAGPDAAAPNSFVGQLHKCVRLLPHQNDAGGFFCAVLTKREYRGALDAAAEPKQPKPKAGHRDVKDAMFAKSVTYHELDCDDVDAAKLVDFYGLRPGALGMVAVSDPKGADRRIVALSRGGRAALTAFSHSRGAMKHRQLQFASFGVRLFKRLKDTYVREAECRWRPCHEGAVLLSDASSRRKLLMSPAALARLVEGKRLGLAELAELRSSAELRGWATVCPVALPAAGAAGAADPAPARPDDAHIPGGVCVGLIPDAVPASLRRTWVACVLTGSELTCYTSKVELSGLLAVLQGNDTVARA